MLHHLGLEMKLFPGSLNINRNISIGLNGFAIFPSGKIHLDFEQNSRSSLLHLTTNLNQITENKPCFY